MTPNKDLEYDKENVWHVLPTSEEHDDGLECWCNPKIEIQDNVGVVVIHKSKDWREYGEQLTAKN